MGFQGLRGDVVRLLCGDIKTSAVFIFGNISDSFFYDRVPPVSKDQQVLLDVPAEG